ncbi:MAG: BrnT family toxin [Rhodocyclaceae bacterium]|nr:BrnT family toxin [Rhodocyclaceae bacterium]
MRLIFDWDDEKEAKNLKKHGIPFEDAAAVFDDPLAKIFPDPYRHEQRYRIIGCFENTCLMVVHTSEEVDDDVILVRIISARKLDKSERKRYENDL